MSVSSKNKVKAYLRFIVKDNGSLRELVPRFQKCIKSAKVKTKLFGCWDTDDYNPSTEDPCWVSFLYYSIKPEEIGRLCKSLHAEFDEMPELKVIYSDKP